MRTLRFWINCLLFLLPILFLSIGSYRFVHRIFGYLNSDARLAGTLSAELSRALEREVRIGDVHISDNLWSLSAPNTIELRDVWVAESRKAPGSLFAHADRVIVHYKISQLLDDTTPRMPFVDEVQIIGPQLTLQRDARGRWNYEDIPASDVKRPFWDKLTFSNGLLTLDDQAFPFPSPKSPRHFVTKIAGLTGTALIRPDKSIAFSVAGIPDSRIAQDFRLVGILDPEPFHASARLLANHISLPYLSEQFVPASMGRVTSGLADIDISGLYALPAGAPPNSLRWDALDAQGSVELSNLNADGPMPGSPLQNVSGNITFVNTALTATLTGRYANLPLNVSGSILGLTRLTELIPTNSKKPALPPLTLAIQVSAQNSDFMHAYRLLKLDQYLPALPAEVRTALRSSEAQGSAEMRILGSLDNPTVSLSSHLNTLKYDTYRAQNVDARLLYADKAVHVALKGRFAEGDADVRASIEPDKNGAFLVEAHGRGLQVVALDLGIEQIKGGKGDLDIAIQGQRDRTPNISAQMQVLDLNLNGQKLHSLYARAETVGRDLVVRTLRAEDARGFALASGTVDLKNQTLALNVDADQLDLAALTKSFVLPSPPGKGDPNAPGTPTSTPLSLSGLGFLRNGKITGRWDNPQFSGRFSLFGLQAGQDALARMDKVTADIRLSRNSLVVSQGAAERYPSLAQFSGVIVDPFSPKPELSFDVAARSLDLGTLLQAAKVDTKQFAVTGTLTTDAPIHIAGTLDNVHLTGVGNGQPGRNPFTIRLQDATINGLLIDNALARITYDVQGLHLDHAEAQTAGGTLTASGDMTKEGQLALTLSGDNLALEQLTAALPEEAQPGLKAQLLPVQGRISLSANLTGTMQDPIINSSLLKSQDLTYNGFHTGPLQTNAGYAGKVLALRNLSVSDPTTQQPVLVAPELDFNTDTHSLRTAAIESANAIRVVNLPIKRLLDLYQHLPDPQTGMPRILPQPISTIEGLLTARVALSGTAEDPRADVVLREEDNHDIHVYTDYLITGLGGKATITKEGINGSSLALTIRPINMPASPARQAGSQEAVVVAPKFSLSAAGDIAADVTVSKLNLAFVQQALNLDPINALSGQGEFINITASGKLDAPELDVSTVLTNVVYRSQKIDRIEVSHAKVKQGLIDIADLYLTRNGTGNQKNTEAYLTGRITGFTWDSPYIPDAAVLDFTAQLPRLPKSSMPNLQSREQQANSWADLKLLSDFGLHLSDDSQGSFLINARVKGTRGAPLLTGSVDVIAPHIKADKFATGLGSVDGTFRLENDRITVEHFTAQSVISSKGNVALPIKTDVLKVGGKIELTGSLPLGLGNNPVTRNQNPLTLMLTGVPFAENPLPGGQGGGVSGKVDGSLRVLGTLLEPILTGQITASDTALALPGQFGEVASGGFNLAMNPQFRNVRLILGNKVQLRSQELNATTDGYIQLDGSLANPRLVGRLNLTKGQLHLGIRSFDILPPGLIMIDYPRSQLAVTDPSLPPIPNFQRLNTSQDSLSVQIDLRARIKNLTATSLSGIRKSYEVTVTAKGSLTDTVGETFTGKPRLALHFETSPGDLAIGDEAIMARLAPSLIGVDNLNEIGRNPGAAFASALTEALTSSFLPGQFDRLAISLGLEQFSINYDPIQRLSLTISRQLVGPLYFTYIRSLSGSQEHYDLKFSLRFRDRYQVSYDFDEQHTQRFLVEGVWRF